MHFKDYTIRPILRDDLRMIIDWRNSEEIHSMMLTNHRIVWEEHIRWFDRIQQEDICRNFVFEYKKQPIGYIGYTASDGEPMTCSPGAYIGDHRNACIHSALYLMYMTVEYAFSVLQMERLETVVLAKNKRALEIDQFIGYKVVSNYTESFGAHELKKEAVVIRLTKEEWMEKRIQLMEYIG